MKFEKSRFHRKYGPDSLFSRAQFLFSKVAELKTHGAHFNERLNTRPIPPAIIHKMKNFNRSEWNLVLVEVRNDTGKFISTTWEIEWDHTLYWVVVGYNNTVQTIIIKDTNGMNDIVKNGDLYNYVDEVNRELMLEENI